MENKRDTDPFCHGMKMLKEAKAGAWATALATKRQASEKKRQAKKNVVILAKKTDIFLERVCEAILDASLVLWVLGSPIYSLGALCYYGMDVLGNFTDIEPFGFVALAVFVIKIFILIGDIIFVGFVWDDARHINAMQTVWKLLCEAVVSFIETMLDICVVILSPLYFVWHWGDQEMSYTFIASMIGVAILTLYIIAQVSDYDMKNSKPINPLIHTAVTKIIEAIGRVGLALSK